MDYRQRGEIIRYLLVGAITTIVSWVAKYIGTFWLDSTIAIHNFGLSTISWTVGVIFGYFANRTFVFKSNEKNVVSEGIRFAGGRLFTWVLEVFIMQILTVKMIPPKWYILVIEEYVADSDSQYAIWYWSATFFCAVIVTITNYIISKIIVFKDRCIK